MEEEISPCALQIAGLAICSRPLQMKAEGLANYAYSYSPHCRLMGPPYVPRVSQHIEQTGVAVAAGVMPQRMQLRLMLGCVGWNDCRSEAAFEHECASGSCSCSSFWVADGRNSRVAQQRVASKQILQCSRGQGRQRHRILRI